MLVFDMFHCVNCKTNRRPLVIARIIYQSIVDYISLIIGNNMNTKLLEIYKNSRNIFDEQLVDRSHHTLLY